MSSVRLCVLVFMLGWLVNASAASLTLGDIPPKEYLRAAWEHVGRRLVRRNAGMQWDAQQGWTPLPNWKKVETESLPRSYYLGQTLQGAVQMAAAWQDRALIDELAQGHLRYLERWTTLGALRAQLSARMSTAMLEKRGSDTARTLPWIEQNAKGLRARECTLCTSQLLHPTARLLRAITTLPEAQRSPIMREFVAAYTPLIVQEHLLRQLYEMQETYGGPKAPSMTLVVHWQAIIAGKGLVKPRFRRIMTDRDLWLVATAAEVLGAHTAAPALVPLSPEEAERLRQAVRVGVQLFQSKRMLVSDTKDWEGKRVGSAVDFAGDYADHPDMAYAGYAGPSFPTPAQKRPPKQGSWDISHICRLPIFLRALHDNKQATGVDFPSAQDVTLSINQYVYRVFNGDFRKPLFANFFDGRDGWYRVGYHGKDSGYPPSRLCDTSGKYTKKRPCLTTGAIYGWGLLASAHADLLRLEQALLTMATSQEPDVVQWRERYYTQDGTTFAVRDAQGKIQYPFLLFILLSFLAEQL